MSSSRPITIPPFSPSTTLVVASAPTLTNGHATIRPNSSQNAGHSLFAQILMAQDCLKKATQTSSPQDIHAALVRWSHIAHHIPLTHPDYEPIMASLAVALMLRWEESQDVKDINAVIDVLQRALNASESNFGVTGETTRTRNKYQNLVNIGSAYLDRYETFHNDKRDLEHAISYWEQAHDCAVRSGMMRESCSQVLGHLGETYYLAYEVGLGSGDFLTYAISHLRSALAHVSQDNRGILHFKIGQSYSALYNRRKQPPDLQSSIQYLTQSLTGSLDAISRQTAIMELSRTYTRKFDQTKHKDDIDTALHWARIGVTENQGEAWILRDLANLLYWLYKLYRDPKALDEAIDYYEILWALYQSKPGRSMPTYYFAFATALIRRFDLVESSKVRPVSGKKLRDIERSVDLLQLAIRSAGSSDAEAIRDYTARLNLAQAKLERAKAGESSSEAVSFPPLSPGPLSPPFALTNGSMATIPGGAFTEIRGPDTGTMQRKASLRRSKPSNASTSTVPPLPAQPIGRTVAPSVISEDISIMTVPPAKDIPAVATRPRVLKRTSRVSQVGSLSPIPPVISNGTNGSSGEETAPVANTPTVKRSTTGKVPEKLRGMDFLRFGLLKSAKATNN